MSEVVPSERRALDRRVLALSWPAFLTLVSEPLFLLADAAVVGRLGTVSLAGLGIAATILQTVIGLCVFLAYGTTAAVARRVGAGDRAGALTQGVDGLWLATGIGLVLTAAGLAFTRPLVGAFGTSDAVASEAVAYLVPAWLGTTPMLLMLATTGVLRGLHDTRTPLYATVAANLANIVLNVVLVHAVGLGIAGAAIGTTLAQLGAATALGTVVVRGVRREGGRLPPHLPGLRRAGRAATPLLVRTATLRASLVLLTWAAAGMGTTTTAAHQLALTLWSFLAFALDAVAIAAQAITGTALGQGDLSLVRRATDRIQVIGLWSGVVTGAVLAGVAGFVGRLFTDDPAVIEVLIPVLLVAAVAQPIAGLVFLLDGVLIGAGDGRYLAWGGTVVLVFFAPAVLLYASVSDGLVGLWAVFVTVFMGGRAVVLVTRARSDRWLVTGADPADQRT